MLLGEHRQAINGIGQVVLPEQVLSELDGALVITRGFERNLILFPDQEWRELASKLMVKPISDHEVRTMRRRLFSDAVEVEADADGRIILPPSLREFAGINGEVVLTGMFNYVELWSAEQWSQVLESVEEDSTGEQWDNLGI